MCERCLHIEQRHGGQADGWCRHDNEEPWGRVPFNCSTYKSLAGD
jgi:hypothetical protein